MASQIVLRAPTIINTSQASAFTPPTPAWLSGTWHVTHSTLPMWKSKRNVIITYNLLPPTSPSIAQEATDKLDDIVSYQSLDSEKTKIVKGIDTASTRDSGAWDWRGRGWLMIASSHWEVLGYGDLEEGQQWAVTYFAKTLFTPAGVDVYSRTKEGLSEAVIAGIKEALTAVDHPGVKTLTEGLVVVKRD